MPPQPCAELPAEEAEFIDLNAKAFNDDDGRLLLPPPFEDDNNEGENGVSAKFPGNGGGGGSGTDGRLN